MEKAILGKSSSFGKKGRPSMPVKYGAITYRSLKHLCDVIKFPYPVMYARLKAGLTLSEARALPIRPYTKFKFVEIIQTDSECQESAMEKYEADEMIETEDA